MKAAMIVIAILSLALGGVCFSFGYRLGAERNAERQTAQGNLARNMGLYQCAEQENWGRLKDNLEISILGQVRYIEHTFGAPSGSNRFAVLFQRASLVASNTESRLVPIEAALRSIPGGSHAEVGVKVLED